MKFKITEIQNQDDTQLNILVDVYRDNGTLLKKRVFTLPHEKYSGMSADDLSEWVRNEVSIYKKTIAKEKDFKILVNKEIDF